MDYQIQNEHHRRHYQDNGLYHWVVPLGDTVDQPGLFSYVQLLPGSSFSNR